MNIQESNLKTGRLKVLFMVSWYPSPEQPVNGIFFREQARAVQLYNEVVVLHCAGFNPAVKGLSKLEEEKDPNLTDGIRTYRVWHRRVPINFGLCKKITRNVLYVYSAFMAFGKLWREGFRPDIIHGHVFEAGFPAVLIGKIFRLPVVVSEHHSVFPRRQLSRGEIAKARWTYRLARKALPVSKFLEKAMEDYGIRANFRIVPNVVNLDIYFPKAIGKNPNSLIKKILFVGLFNRSSDKGISYLFLALADLRKKRDDWHLDLVGDGPARIEYEEMASRMELGDKVSFQGMKTRNELADHMRGSEFLVMPSLAETFSLVTAEAMACGKPVIVTKCGGPEEFVTEETGILIPPENSKALLEAIDYMLDNYRNYSSEGISQSVKGRFSRELVGKRLDQIYRESIV